MPPLQAVSLTALFLEHDNLLGSTLFSNLCCNLGVFQDRLADLDIVAIDDHQHLGEINTLTDIALKFFNSNLISTCNLVLLTAGTNYGIHITNLF